MSGADVKAAVLSEIRACGPVSADRLYWAVIEQCALPADADIDLAVGQALNALMRDGLVELYDIVRDDNGRAAISFDSRPPNPRAEAVSVLRAIAEFWKEGDAPINPGALLLEGDSVPVRAAVLEAVAKLEGGR
jgi:hypothetical protein